MQKSGIAVDLGGTKCAGAIVSPEGKILNRKTVRVAGLNGKKVGASLAELTGALIEESKRLKRTVAGICVSVPGIAYPSTGKVWAPNIPGWNNYPLKSDLESRIGGRIPVSIDNDRACSILGEAWMGAARNCQDAIFLAVGTGIGAGILSGGNMIRGSSGIAGATGWMALDSDYKPGYRQFGSFEYNASGNGLTRVAQDELNRSAWEKSKLKAGEDLDAGAIFRSFEQGDPLAVRVIENAITYWGKGVANFVSLFNPEVIIFGGGIFGPGVSLLSRIREEAKKWAQPVSMKRVKLVPSALGQDAALYGAGRIALKMEKL